MGKGPFRGPFFDSWYESLAGDRNQLGKVSKVVHLDTTHLLREPTGIVNNHTSAQTETLQLSTVI